jgi:hypothetical protein
MAEIMAILEAMPLVLPQHCSHIWRRRVQTTLPLKALELNRWRGLVLDVDGNSRKDSHVPARIDGSYLDRVGTSCIGVSIESEVIADSHRCMWPIICHVRA